VRADAAQPGPDVRLDVFRVRRIGRCRCVGSAASWPYTRNDANRTRKASSARKNPRARADFVARRAVERVGHVRHRLDCDEVAFAEITTRYREKMYAVAFALLKNRADAGYCHLASAADDDAVKTLQQRDFFKHYTEKTRQVAAGGDVTVTPIEWIAETASA